MYFFCGGMAVACFVCEYLKRRENRREREKWERIFRISDLSRN